MTERGKEDLDLVSLLNQSQLISSLVHLPVSPVRAYEKDQFRPRQPQRVAGHAPPYQQIVRQKCMHAGEGKELGWLWPDQKGGLGEWWEKTTGSSGGKYRMCL